MVNFLLFFLVRGESRLFWGLGRSYDRFDW